MRLQGDQEEVKDKKEVEEEEKEELNKKISKGRRNVRCLKEEVVMMVMVRGKKEEKSEKLYLRLSSFFYRVVAVK